MCPRFSAFTSSLTSRSECEDAQPFCFMFSDVFETVVEHALFTPSFSKAQPSKVQHRLVLRLRRKDKCGTSVFSKAQPSTFLHLLYFRSLGLAKCSIYYDVKSSAKQNIKFSNVSKARP